MYIKTGSNAYPCTGYCPYADEVRFTLTGDIPVELGETVQLHQDDDFLLAEHTVADFARWEAVGGVLLLTNRPKAEPQEPAEEATPEPTELERLRADVDFLAALQGVSL